MLLMIHVDDGVCAGRPKEIAKVMECLKKEVEVLEIGWIDTHLAVNYELRKDEIGWYFECEMRKYVMDVVDDFEREWYGGEALPDRPTPMMPGQCLLKSEPDATIIDISSYQKYVGRLLYAITKVIPDCANTIRELSCYMSAPSGPHWRALKQLLCYLKHRYKPLKLRAPTELRVIAAFDADWASDKNDRKSISSYVTTIGGTALTNFQSKKQQTVVLSSCEAETMAGTLCAQDVLFTRNLLREIVGERLLSLSYIYGDNVASLFLAQNNSLGQRSKHIDIKHRFMHDLVVNDDVELRHVRSEDNSADIGTKSVTIETHEKLSDQVHNGLIIAKTSTKEDVESICETPKNEEEDG